MGKVKDTDRTNITIPGYARATWNGERHDLRVFHETDRARAAELAKVFTDVGLRVDVTDLSGNAETANKARPNTFELWFGRGALPASCGA